MLQNDRGRRALFSSDDPTPAFVGLLQRARLHRHVAELAGALAGWRAGASSVWDVVELVERLRAQHVLDVSLLRLEEHEWAAMVDGAAETAARPREPIHFEAGS